VSGKIDTAMAAENFYLQLKLLRALTELRFWMRTVLGFNSLISTATALLVIALLSVSAEAAVEKMG
jgi:ABC-type transporter lipoprotein component MlaA